jgi:cytidine deaminase
MTRFDPDELLAKALAVATPLACSQECTAGGVGAAALSETGEVFTGICIDARCGLGCCAEYAAIAEMLKRRLTHIVAIVAVTSSGEIIPPCGRCRELIRQVDPANWETKVVVATNDIVRLADLLPHARASAKSAAPRPTLQTAP